MPDLYETFMGYIFFFFTGNQINFPSSNSACIYFEHICNIIEIFLNIESAVKLPALWDVILLGFRCSINLSSFHEEYSHCMES